MIENMQEKYQQLNKHQKQIFAGYGLRQIKHFVEISLPKVEACLPPHATVQGINAEGKVQAFDAQNQKKYLWISDQQWQESGVSNTSLDLKEDFIAVWHIFNLSEYALIDLSHIHRDFLAQQSV